MDTNLVLALLGLAHPSDLALFLLASFLGSLVAGLAGFAFGLVASGIWLHAITPVQSAILIAAFACVVQTQATWRLRHAVRIERIWPFVLGGVFGIPLGVEVLRFVSQQTMRGMLGVFLVAFSAYYLAASGLRKAPQRPLLDLVVGFGGGIVGALTGLAGIVVNVWTTAQGLPKDEQRAVFQPTAVILFIFTLVWFAVAGFIDRRTVYLFLIGLPLVLVGTWLGLRLYGRLDQNTFRRMVLALLLVSGLTLLPSMLG